MEYTLTGQVNCTPAALSEYLFEPRHMLEWQETLLFHEQLSGEPGKTGATARLVHRFGRSRVEMLETIEIDDLPHCRSMIYEAKSAWNRVVYRFWEPSAGVTTWEMQCQFRCRGFLRLVAFLHPGIFRKTTEKEMNRLACYVLAQNRNSDNPLTIGK